MKLIFSALVIHWISFMVAEREVILETVAFKGNSSYLSYINVSIVNNALFAEAQFIQRLESIVLLTIDFQLRLRDAKAYQHIVRYDINYCNAFGKTVIGPLMCYWYDLIKQQTNFMRTCPIEQGNYFINELIFSARAFPVYLPAGDYRLLIEVHRQSKQHQQQQRLPIFVLQVILYIKIHRI